MTQQTDILTRIAICLPNLREAEKKVANTIKDDPVFCSQANISDIAKRVGVSEASVTRLAKALGCKDVREMKVLLAQSLAVGQRFVATPVNTDIGGIFQGIRDLLDHNEKRIDEMALKESVRVISKAENTIIFGCGGGSTIMAQEAQNRMFRLGIRCSAVTDGLMARMMASTLRAGDVLLVFSLTGYTPEVLEISMIAKRYGARVVAITQAGSPLATVMDCGLLMETFEGDDIYRPTSSRYAALLMLDILALRLAQVNGEDTQDNLRRIKVSLDEHRKGHDRLPLGD
ncbi:transcriptional regulator [Veronia nyctiphanis]|uniref:Transcriptional regulator n=1 Tax=Veronia nyctiphanis TaxID=1278244 RepID=A0A4Q0YMW4_9GAMM|nr:MurR/RpiR family transcriptional regulator [Veronia nyctiphanis]RXJ71783.1 transcriptional regulator [Veronia nyctiphanis]